MKSIREYHLGICPLFALLFVCLFTCDHRWLVNRDWLEQGCIQLSLQYVSGGSVAATLVDASERKYFCMMLSILLDSFFIHNQLLYIHLQQLVTENPCLITCKRNSSLYIIHKTEMSQWLVTPKKNSKQIYLTTAIANVFSTSALLYIFYSRNKMKCIF